MNNKTKHLAVDWIALGFMLIGFAGTFFISMIFCLIVALGILTMLFNEKLNPFDAEQKDGE